MLYCWGSSSCGQLGLPGEAGMKSGLMQEAAQEEGITQPTAHTLLHAMGANIIQVGAGLEHALFLTDCGAVYACGNGEVGQLGVILPPCNKQVLTPVRVAGLEAHNVVAVAAGDQHSVAVTSYGEVFAWGDNTFGQTGVGGGEDRAVVSCPLRVKSFAHQPVVQIAAGANHTLALTADGAVWGWGLNKHGQLGMKTKNPLLSPRRVISLDALPIMQVVCGGQSSGCVTRAGYLLTWGSNRTGQLGRGLGASLSRDKWRGGSGGEDGSGGGKRGEGNGPTCTCAPEVVQQLAIYSDPVVFAAAGTSHMAAIDGGGKLWTFGNGSSGQLGHGGTGVKAGACTVMDLVGSHVTQVACGRNHTVVATAGQVYSFGEGSSGQLGVAQLPSVGYVTVPLPIAPSWRGASPPPAHADACVQTADPDASSSSDMSVGQDADAASSPVTPLNCKQIFCGGDCSFLISTPDSRACIDAAAPRRPATALPPAELPEAEAEAGVAMALPPPDLPPEYNIRDGSPAHRPEGASAVPLPVYELQLKHLQRIAALPLQHQIHQDVFCYMETALGSTACWNQSFLPAPPSGRRDHDGPCVDLSAAQAYMTAVAAVTRDTLSDMILHAVEKLVSALPVAHTTFECLRVYVLVPLTPHFAEPNLYKTVHGPYATKINLMRAAEGHNTIGKWLRRLPKFVLQGLVRSFRAVVEYHLDKSAVQQTYIHPDMVEVFEFLRFLYSTNQEREDKVALDDFYVKAIFTKVNVAEDYIRHRDSNFKHSMRFMNVRHYSDYPFLFGANVKVMLLQVDAQIQKQTARHAAFMEALPQIYSDFSALMALMAQGIPNEFGMFNITVARNNIIQDTLRAITAVDNLRSFKLPLKVQFTGEEAEDVGGVRREFFMLLMRELMTADYGMFTHIEESQYIWFNEGAFEDASMFYLVGTLCGLAIYNAVIIELAFPLALYKKLLGKPVGIGDLQELEPTVVRSLRKLLKYEGDDFEEVMGLSFCINRVSYGATITTDLLTDGSNIPVTKENRRNYVELVVDHMLTESMKKQYNAFHKGFHDVCGSDILRLFQPSELMAMVVGNEDYDWQVFEDNTLYKGVFHAQHETIVFFWTVFHALILEDKKKFLKFLTGCDRVPTMGMVALKMVIASCEDTRRLPVAHTCVLQLDLPVYATQERLHYKLVHAIEHYEGFGLV